MARARELRRSIDWGSLAPLALRSREVAEGVYAGGHRSARRGAGVEFGGHREYVPGDDLRWLDRRSLLRHDHLLVRQFETETDRALRLVVDATLSMTYRGDKAPGAKIAFAASSRRRSGVAVSSGDPVGLTFIGGEEARGVPGVRWREAFERLMAALESVQPGGDARTTPEVVERALAGIARTARRGSIIVILSDLLDLPESAVDLFASLASRGRVLVVVQTLDADEGDAPVLRDRAPPRARGRRGRRDDPEATRGALPRSAPRAPGPLSARARRSRRSLRPGANRR
ncbi:MAG: DUF58 domain-containing protein [Polyangiaceae bacterium]